MKFGLFLFSFLFFVSVCSVGIASPDAGPGDDESPAVHQKQVTHPPRVKKARSKRRRRCRRTASPRYQRMVRRWQRKPKVGSPKFRQGYRDLVIYSVNSGERLRVFPYLPDGTIDSEAMESIEHLFRDKDTDAEHPIHPRLIKLLYKLADRFKAKQINIVSGYRESSGAHIESNHGKGRAVDFMIPGIAIGPVVYNARLLGHVGVGIYPNSGFIHLDVRNGPSYFWVDPSGPGYPGCPRRILTQTAAKSDRKWRPKHDDPRIHRNRKGEPLGAIEEPELAMANATHSVGQ